MNWGDLAKQVIGLGAPILGIWYWCTDQVIVQRVLSAKDEGHARAGTIFAGFLKILPVFILVLPGLIAFEPGSEREARLAIRWAVEKNPESTYLRFCNVPLDLPYTMPADYTLHVGRGVTLRHGTDVAIIGYGTILLTNAWKAADELAQQGIAAAVIDLPWLNRIDDEWVKTLGAYKQIVTLDNHYLEYGQGVMIAAALARNNVRSEVSPIGLKEIPACGSNADVLAYHGLDPAGIARVASGNRTPHSPLPTPN